MLVIILNKLLLLLLLLFGDRVSLVFNSESFYLHLPSLGLQAYAAVLGSMLKNLKSLLLLI